MSENSHRVAIPNLGGWGTIPFGELCSNISRGTAPLYVKESEVLAIGQRCITEDKLDIAFARPHSRHFMARTVVPAAGDVLLNSTGTGTIGRCCYFDEPGRFIIDGHITRMRPRSESTDGRWLTALIRSSWGQRFLETRCYSGSTNQIELARTQLAEGVVPAPPLAEQHAIAAILDTIDDTIRKTEQIIEKLRQVKQGLMHDLLTRGIDDNGELRDPLRHPEQFQNSPLGRIPKEWKVAPLQDIAAISKLAGFEYTSHVRYCDDGEIIAIRPLNIKNERIDLADIQRITKRVSDSLPRSKIGNNDLVLTYIGAYIGEVALIAEDDRFHLAPNICRIRPRPGVVPDCLLWTVRSHIVRKQFSKFISTTATPSMTMASVRSTLVPQPRLEEQRAISSLINAAHTRQLVEEKKATKQRALRAGLAEDLLTGRVRTTSLGEITP